MMCVVSETYACRHTLRAEARSMTARSGRSTEEGMTQEFPAQVTTND